MLGLVKLIAAISNGVNLKCVIERCNYQTKTDIVNLPFIIRYLTYTLHI